MVRYTHLHSVPYVDISITWKIWLLWSGHPAVPGLLMVLAVWNFLMAYVVLGHLSLFWEPSHRASLNLHIIMCCTFTQTFYHWFCSSTAEFAIPALGIRWSAKLNLVRDSTMTEIVVAFEALPFSQSLSIRQPIVTLSDSRCAIYHTAYCRPLETG